MPQPDRRQYPGAGPALHLPQVGVPEVDVRARDPEPGHAVVQQYLQLQERHPGLQREARVGVPEGVPDQRAEGVLPDLLDVARRRGRREQPGAAPRPGREQSRSGADRGRSNARPSPPFGLGTRSSPLAGSSWSALAVLAAVERIPDRSRNRCGRSSKAPAI